MTQRLAIWPTQRTKLHVLTEQNVFPTLLLFCLVVLYAFVQTSSHVYQHALNVLTRNNIKSL